MVLLAVGLDIGVTEIPKWAMTLQIGQMPVPIVIGYITLAHLQSAFAKVVLPRQAGNLMNRIRKV